MIRLGRPSFETLLTWTFVLVGVLWGAFLGARQIAGIDSGFDRLEYLTLDWRFLPVLEQIDFAAAYRGSYDVALVATSVSDSGASTAGKRLEREQVNRYELCGRLRNQFRQRQLIHHDKERNA